MFLKLLARVLALLIVAPILWVVSTRLLGWSHPFLSWYVPAFVLGFIGTFAVDGVVWLWRHLTMRATDPPSALAGGGNSENTAGS